MAAAAGWAPERVELLNIQHGGRDELSGITRPPVTVSRSKEVDMANLYVNYVTVSGPTVKQFKADFEKTFRPEHLKESQVDFSWPGAADQLRGSRSGDANIYQRGLPDFRRRE